MNSGIGQIVIIQACAFQVTVVQGEAEWFDQMQLAAGVGAQANDIAGVGWDFRLLQNNVQHEVLKRFDHNQDDDGNQQQYWKFVKPAIKNMAVLIAIVPEAQQ